MGSELLIKNGRVIDPANGIDQKCDVLITDGKVAEVGKIKKTVQTVIDAEGKQTQLDLSHILEFNKITIGFVIQKFRKDNTGKFKCTHQEFIAGDDVQFENVKGKSIETPEHEYQQFNMILLSSSQIIERLGDVLTSIDVGGEQSRQFAHEIKILDELLRDLGWTRQE